MAGVDLGADKPQKGDKKGLRRPKRRISIRIDMTPMVDIAFLLLIFYMVTTVFSQPLRMEISLPPKPEEGTEPTSIKIAESKLLQMFVDKDDSLYYQIGKDMKQPETINFVDLTEIIRDKNRNVDDLVMVLKLDQDASYVSMVNIIDEIQSIERAINAELAAARRYDPSITQEDYSVRFSLQDMTAWDEHVLKTVKEGGTVE
jgi:biopolymer transport protein ExbD